MSVTRASLYELIGGWPAPQTDTVSESASASTVAANAVSDNAHSGSTTGARIRESHSLPATLLQACRSVQTGDVRFEHRLIPNSRSSACLPVNGLPAVMSLPAGDGPFPAVVYCHAHGSRYEIGKQELLTGRLAMPCGGYALELAQLGIAALCIDLPCFGERNNHSESALSKRLLWQGDTLFGVMLRELAACVDYLQSRADIDAQRIGTLGLSMGSTLSWWLAALDERVTLVAELCCLADLQTLVEQDAHDRHGIYMMVPGLLKYASTADINRLIAPRPHFCAVGRRDSLTPENAFNVIDASLRSLYAELGKPAHWQSLVSEHTGHEETPAMRQALLHFLALHL